MRMNHQMGRRIGGALLGTALAAVGCARQGDDSAASSGAGAAPVQRTLSADPEKVLVQVHQATLTEGELARQADEQFARISAMIPPEQADAYRDQMRVQLAQNFIVTTLLETEAAKRGITVETADVEQAIAEISARIPADMSLEKVLEMEEMTLDTFKSRLRKDLKIKKMFDQEIGVSDQEIADFYEQQKPSFELPDQVSVSHIFVKAGDSADATAKAERKAKAEDLKKQLDGGADFAALAKASSECPSAKDGGVLPSHARGDADEPFTDPAVEAAAFSQAVGVIGPVVESALGYHLLKVNEKQEGRVSPLDEVKDKIADYLRMTKSREVIPPFIDKLREAAKVTVDPALQQQMDAQRLAAEAEMNAGADTESGAPDSAEAPAAP